MKKGFVFEIYKSNKMVFTLQDISLILRENDFDSLKSKVHYYTKRGVLRAVRRGVYVKPEYEVYELATRIYTPSYISLETVLQKEGVIFQYYDTVFVVSYLSRNVVVDKHKISLRKIKHQILLNMEGILQKENYAIATKERAFLDTLYLYKDYHFDNVKVLDRDKIASLLRMYNSKSLKEKVKKILT